MKLDFKSILKPSAILLAICVIVSAALAGTNLLTKDKIAEAQAQKAEESRKIVIPEAAYFEELEERELPENCEGGSVYKAWNKEGEGRWVIGYVFETSAKGYGGDIKVMTGITGMTADDGDITGVVILSHGETPGLGANAEKEEFRNQYQQPPAKDGIEVVKYQVPAEGQIEAMTGATITSRAVTDAVNQAVEQWEAVMARREMLALT